jgi:poly-gamma-glutamate capsule biosynthesis protein CapA/YwtB (metallophosphatase superfamily)
MSRAGAALIPVVVAALLAGCAGATTTEPRAPSPPASSTASTTTPSPEPEPEPQRRPVTTRLLVVGDLMLGRRVAEANPGRPVRPLRHLAPAIRGADIAVGNLESTLDDAGPPQQGDDSFAAPPGTLRGLEQLGFDAMSLANNHTGDFGEEMLLDTVRGFRRSGVAGFGAGGDLAAAGRPAVVEHRGVRFGFVGFNAIGETPRAGRGRPGALSVRMPIRTASEIVRPDLDHVLGIVRRLRREVDVVVVLPHWGDQYTHAALPVQSTVARALVRAGADLVVGGHPHWVQGLERVGDAVVAHSLGNAVFDMDFMEQTMEGVTLTATFRDDRLVEVELEPYRMGADFAPRPLRGAGAAAVLADVRAHHVGRYRAP